MGLCYSSCWAMKFCDLAIACCGIILAMLIEIQSTSPFATALEVTLLLPMLDYMANLTHIFVVSMTLVPVVAVLVVAGLHSH